jgi:cold shock CspA family protein
MKGTVKTWRGSFGWLRGEDGQDYLAPGSHVDLGVDQFVQLEVGQPVRFTPATGPRGLVAHDVRPIGYSAKPTRKEA